MNPDEIPADLVRTANQAWRDAPQKRDGKPTRMRHALAAAWPEIERHVLRKANASLSLDGLVEAAAKALRDEAYDCDGHCGLSDGDCWRAHPINWSCMVRGETHVDGAATDLARVVLESALPELDRQVRAEIARGET